MKVDSLVATYMKLRDKKEEEKKRYEERVRPIEQAMAKIEAALLDAFNRAGIESTRTPHGTAYISTVSSVRKEDGDLFFQFLRDKELWHLADIRPAKKAVEEYLVETGMTPPGISLHRVQKLNIRRSK